MRFIFIFFLILGNAIAQSNLQHGGPVRSLAVKGDLLASGSFDHRILLWDLKTQKPFKELVGHETSVNALLWLTNGELVSGSEDGEVIFWKGDQPSLRVKAHESQVSALAQSPQGLVASTGWDGQVRLYGESARILKTAGEKNIGLSFSRDEMSVISDGGMRVTYNTSSFEIKQSEQKLQPLNRAIEGKNGLLLLGSNNGTVSVISKNSYKREVGETPLIALALNGTETRFAAANIGGGVSVYDLATGSRLYGLIGPGLPVWSVAFSKDFLITGGMDRSVRFWKSENGEPLSLPEVVKQANLFEKKEITRGEEVYRACQSCHSLKPEGENKAGPSLYKIIGLKVASNSKYNYSESIRQHNFIWTRDRLKKLFEIGPQAYLAGTKMPEQRINNEADLEALVDYIETQN